MVAGAATRPYMRPRSGKGTHTPARGSAAGLDGDGCDAKDSFDSHAVTRPCSRVSRSTSGGGSDSSGAFQQMPELQLRTRRTTSPPTQLQHGVLRSNCIDCLDRTNVAQFAYGLGAFGRQLHDMGITDVTEVDSDASAALALMEMYEGMGHELARQYGGSEAHAVFFQRKKGEWEAATQSRDIVTSIRCGGSCELHLPCA